MEIAGIALDPTARASLGAAFQIFWRWHWLAALAVPCVWLGQRALTLYVLSGPNALAPTLGLVIGIGGLQTLGKTPIAQRGQTLR